MGKDITKELNSTKYFVIRVSSEKKKGGSTSQAARYMAKF